jgi:hypothetical protein
VTRWAICGPDRPPIEINLGDAFHVEVDGELKPTRMEFRHFVKGGPMDGRTLHGLPGEYYSVDGYWLRNGMRAAWGEG